MNRKQVLTGVTFGALGAMGMSLAFFGAGMPVMRQQWQLSIEAAGLLMAGMLGGIALASFFGGIMSDFLRKEHVLLAGCVLLGAGSLFINAFTQFIMIGILMGSMGFGAGLILSGSNALLVGLYPRQKGAILNFHHVFFGIGSLAGPLIMSALIQHGRWAPGFTALGAWLLLLCPFFLRAASPQNSHEKLSGKIGQIFNLLKNPGFILLNITNFLATGAQFALIFLSVTFLTGARNISISTAGLVLSLFFVFLVAGRLGCGALSLRITNTRIIMGLLVLQTASLLLMRMGGDTGSMIGVVLGGLACSGIFPCLLALTGILFPKMAGSALGVLATMGGLGGMALCRGFTFVAEKTDLATGFWILVIAGILVLCVFTMAHRSLNLAEQRARARG